MSAPQKIRSGYFIIADISGYTSFVSGTELEHAQSILDKVLLDLISNNNQG